MQGFTGMTGRERAKEPGAFKDFKSVQIIRVEGEDCGGGNKPKDPTVTVSTKQRKQRQRIQADQSVIANGPQKVARTCSRPVRNYGEDDSILLSTQNPARI